MSTQITTSIPLVQQLISICKTQSIHHIVISPGSRNAPLTIGFSNDSMFSCYSIVDERCAAFFALGIAKQTKKPAALVCTSGSALLNYYPAIAEAFYSDIPLVILSADRPKEYIDIGDGQTIRQEHVFANHILYEANLNNNPSYTKDLFNDNTKLITEALYVSLNKQGPVHINIPLYEPLYNTENKEIKPFSIETDEAKALAYEIPNTFLELWGSATKKIILVGVLSPNSVGDDILDKLMKDPNVLLFTETTSNLHHSKAIHGIDQLITKLSLNEFKELKPELLLTFGGLVVSKKIKAFLRDYSPKNHWHIDVKKAYDTYNCLTEHVKATPEAFLEQLLSGSSIKVNSNYQQKWLGLYSQKLNYYEDYLKKSPYSDLTVYKNIIDLLPHELNLHLSNSSTIRYTQLFKLPKRIDVSCNRGTSGIDGSTSTAIGSALAQEKPTLLITGDLSFFYDSNALWNNYIPRNFKIIIINNSGGGIFRILPGDKDAEYFSKYLETTHNYKAKQLAEMYDFNYQLANENTLSNCLNSFFKSSSNEILEIETPRQVNDRVLLGYFC